ncbi:DUF922 domain-containing protein [Flavimarina sp. Hel_I_48]|uniref:DUF922 domain-containing protein n=1 Tax=Flavimarina sp. Hel_I_48 TaxID=1392488 RepID=UPI0004DF3467|nr:DUF922 domain-containing protein [Flavimarina sp. Hel_I_48]
MPHVYQVLGMILFFSCATFAQQPRYSWSEKKDFSWADLSGFPDEQSLYAASVNTGISQDFSISFKGGAKLSSLQITAYIYPKLSWYKPGRVNAALLEHERLHFMITEVHARMLKETISKFDFSEDIRSEMNHLYRKIEQKRQKMQQDFDAETRHGLNNQRELFWEEKVNQLLAKY